MLSPFLLLPLFLTVEDDAAALARSTRVAVEVHGSNEHLGRQLAEQALEPAEAAARRVRAWLGAAAGEPGPPATVHVYRRPARFPGLLRRGLGPADEAGRQCAVERAAFVETDAREAHVDLAPRYGEDALKDVGLPPPTLRRVAEMSARLALADAAPGLPEGLLAGLAGASAQAVLVEGGESVEQLEDPWRASRVAALQRRAAEGPLPGVVELLVGAPQGLPVEELDVLRTLLVEHLGVEHLPSAVLALGEGGAEALAAALLGPDPATVEASFRSACTAFVPLWVDEDGATSGPPEGILQVGLEEREVACWKQEPIEADAYTIRGEFLPLAGGRCQFNVLFAREDGSHFLLNVSRDGETYAYVQSGRAWEELQYAPTPPLPPGRPTAFEVRVGDDRVELHLAGREVFAVALQGHSVRGAWGIGTPARSACMWRGLRVEER